MASRKSKKPEENTETAPAGGAPDLGPVVGKNLRRLRTERGLSLEKLAQLSGVSRAMLGQVELGQSAPTINVLWKIARAVDVPFSALIATTQTTGAKVLRSDQSKRLLSHDGTFQSRALFPYDEPRRVEFYELKLLPGCIEAADSHAPGTVENLVVSKGSLDIEADGVTHHLSAGDAILFEADVKHSYRNTASTEAIVYLVMTYAEQVG